MSGLNQLAVCELFSSRHAWAACLFFIAAIPISVQHASGVEDEVQTRVTREEAYGFSLTDVGQQVSLVYPGRLIDSKSIVLHLVISNKLAESFTELKAQSSCACAAIDLAKQSQVLKDQDFFLKIRVRPAYPELKQSLSLTGLNKNGERTKILDFRIQGVVYPVVRLVNPTIRREAFKDGSTVPLQLELNDPVWELELTRAEVRSDCFSLSQSISNNNIGTNSRRDIAKRLELSLSGKKPLPETDFSFSILCPGRNKEDGTAKLFELPLNLAGAARFRVYPSLVQLRSNDESRKRVAKFTVINLSGQDFDYSATRLEFSRFDANELKLVPLAECSGEFEYKINPSSGLVSFSIVLELGNETPSHLSLSLKRRNVSAELNANEEYLESDKIIVQVSVASSEEGEKKP